MMKDRIRGSRLALVVVDPQEKFELDVPDWDRVCRDAVDGINRYTRMFREHGAPVIFICFDGLSHMHPEIGDSWLPGIETSDSDIVVKKQHMSCFKQTELEKILRGLGVESTLFIGMLTEFCVGSTYFSASERGFNTYLGKGALIAYNEKGNEAAEVIFSMVDEGTVLTYLEGRQEPITDPW